MSSSPEGLEQLSSRVDELEKRVYALEHPEKSNIPAVGLVASSAKAASAVEGRQLQAGSIFPTVGRALLGIAGAYVLRAIAAAGVMPEAAVAAVAIVYALGWLLWAVRPSQASGLLQVVYAGTSALILMPMLWEVTLHFQAFPAIATAGVLAGFAVLGSVLHLRKHSPQIVWITHGAVSITAIALAIATQHILPFVFLLLLSVLLNEIARTVERAAGVEHLVNLAADAAIWGMIFIYSGPQNARAEYPQLNAADLVIPPCLLFGINGTGVGIRTIVRERRISVMETIQTIIAFVLTISGVIFFTSTRGIVALGIFCLILSAAAYIVTFRNFLYAADARNLRVFGMWSAALMLAGVLWAFPPSGAAIALAVSALIAYALSNRANSRMLDLHGAIYLIAATAFSGLPQYIVGTLAGTVPGRPSMSVDFAFLCAAFAFAFTKDIPKDSWYRKAIQFIPALIATCAGLALMVHAVLALASLGLSLGVPHIAFLRTFTISTFTMCLAFAGSHWGRAAITQLAYVALTFEAAKLLFEDLRHGHMEFIAASIFLFAITLIAVPRLIRLGAKSRSARAEIPVETRT